LEENVGKENYNKYSTFLQALNTVPFYSGDGWVSGLVQHGFYPFQRLIRLLRDK